ncbi:MAG: hypothetical protein ACM3NW_03950 [Syntrophomonadaceae bacterium]
MPFDLLSALTRLEGNLRKKLSQRTRHPRRLLFLLVLAPLLSLALYAGAARWFLSGPGLRALINTNPESLTLDYDDATSLWPGRVTIRNLRIRGSDHNAQWIIRLAEARVDYSVPALARRTFRAERVRGSGLSFSVRNKLEAGEAKNADLSVLPPIPGFADPPLWSPEAQGPEAAGNPWRIEVRGIEIDHFDEIWFDAYHYRGTARLDGAFFLRPGLLVSIGPARVSVESGAVQIGRAPVGVSISGSIEGAFEPFEPPKVHGSEVWQKTSGAVKLDARFDRLESLEHLFSSGGARLEEGAGKATIHAGIERGIAKGEIRLAVHDGSVRLEKLALRGDADLRLLIPEWNLMSGPLEISGSHVAFSDVRASGSDDSRHWWGRFDIRSGKIDSTTTMHIDGKTRDARPLLALLAADLPAWTRGLVDLDEFSATGIVSLGRSLTRVEHLDARGGSYHIQGHYLRDKSTRDGAFLIESGSLSVGLELQPAATKLRLLGAKNWYEEQRDARSSGPKMGGGRKSPRIIADEMPPPARVGREAVRVPVGHEP